MSSEVRIGSVRWLPGAKRRWKGRFDKLQKFVDNNMVRHMSEYVPHRTGKLQQSVISGSRMGSGILIYRVPYARKQYYLEHRRIVNGKRDSRWFERMWADRHEQVVREVHNYARRVFPQ